MLELVDIKKDYVVAGGVVNALKGVSIKFRKNEFVSILGASGCGKTTLLNIIGGLDTYTSGDLIIEGKSTKQYDDGDWDTYRNHSIGFIFQSYHLIPHQTILQNVELALVIAGVDKEERRRRAIEALDKVGLKDKINNRPNQLSGGQAQRVAIARALINDPEIVLADEPTGALDSKTGVQVMELLKEIAKDRLVIMVTHNPELAKQYSTRTIRLLDGEVVDDDMPYDGSEEAPEKVAPETPAAELGGEGNSAELSETKASEPRTNKGKKKKTSMSTGMAFSLSLKNLLSKRGRTAMVSVAGSIGIIGVSMVLAISSGVQGYIKDMENDMLSGYPLSVTETAIDFNALMDFANSSAVKADALRLKNKVYVDSLLETLMGFSGSMTTNNITSDYKAFVDAMPKEYYNALQYGYDFDMSKYIFSDFTVDGTAETTQNVSVAAIRSKYTSVLEQQESYKDYAPMISTVSSFKELPDNYEYVLSQYDILASDTGSTKIPENELKAIFEDKSSLVMVVNDNGFSDLNFGQYGYMTEDEFLNFAYKAEGTTEYDKNVIEEYEKGVSFDKFVGENAHSFKWYPNDTLFVEAGDEKFTVSTQYGDIPMGAEYKYLANSEKFDAGRDKSNDVDLKVRLILQKKDNISYGCLNSGLFYTNALTRHTLKTGIESNIAKYIGAIDGEDKTLKWLPYKYDYTYKKDGQYTTVNDATGYVYETGDMMSMMGGGSTSQADMLKVGLNVIAGIDLPSAFYIYPVNFENKSLVTNYLDRWNVAAETEGGGTLTFTDADGNERTISLEEADKVQYTDTVGLIITMVNTMIEMVTIALVAFTALSLVVSTVMVGIITYVSVVERVKEIGILRAVGARKKDIKRLFNAETFIIGLAAGVVGIVITYLLSFIINMVVGALFGIFTIAALPWYSALIMVLISVALTLISGLIPASAAAQKDPVVALRTE